MLPEIIKNRVELKFGKAIRYPKDCESLALTISKQVKEKISATTLMRLFCIINNDTKPRLYTLDVIAQYIGFSTWDEVMNESALCEIIYKKNIYKITINSLQPQQVINVAYLPDSELKMQYQGENELKIIKSLNCKIKTEDVVLIHRLDNSFPLVCETVIRNGITLGKFVGDKEEVITHLSIDV